MTMRFLTLVALVIACTALAPGGIGAQAPGSPLVHVDVSVVDDAGVPVRGLGPDDFELAVDGAPVRPAGFSPIDLALPDPAVTATPAPGLLAPRHVPFDVERNDDLIDRYVVLVLDDIRPAGDDAAGAWMASTGLDVARAVVERLTPADRGAIFFTWLGRRQGLTGDRARLLAALDGFAVRPVTPDQCGPAGCLVDTLQGAADILPGTPPQRKVVLYISGGTPVPSLPVPAAGAAAATAVERVYASLQRANAVVYSITPPGVVAAAPNGAVPLTEATGGRAMVGTVTGAQVDALFREASAYYLLSLPIGGADGGFRPIDIRVKRPGAHVRVRPGVFTVTEPAPPATLSPLEAALVAPHTGATLPLGVTAAVFAAPDGREAVVSVVAAVTGAAASGAKSWQAEVATTAFDLEWRPRASHRQTIEVTPRPGAPTLTIDVISALGLLPGRYELRVAADSSGRTGSVFVDLDVPDFRTAPLAASGVVITTLPVPYTASERLAAVLPVTPTTRRAFRAGESAEAFVRFYQVSGDRLRDVDVSLRIADTRGEGIIQGTEVLPAAQFTETGFTDWRFVLPLDRLTPGEYLLTITARVDGATEVRHVRFGVVR